MPNLPAIVGVFALLLSLVPSATAAQWTTLDGRPLSVESTLVHEGVDFDIGDPKIVVDGDDAIDVQVGGQIGTLHVLHNLKPGPTVLEHQAAAIAAKQIGEKPADRLTVATHQVHYVDGVVLDVPVRWDEAIHDAARDSFWDRKYNMLGDLAWADVAAMRVTDQTAGQVEVLYAMHWPNPRPEVAVERVTLAAPGEGCGTMSVLGVATDDELPSGRVLFVSPNGSADAAGTFDEPKGDLFGTMASLQPGDTLYVRGGRYTSEQRFIGELIGTVDEPIVVCGYPGETATLDASRYTFSNEPMMRERTESPFRDRFGYLHIAGSQHLTIRNLHLENMISMGILATGVREVSLLHNSFYLAPASAIYLAGHDSRANHNLAIRACSLVAFAEHFKHDPARATDPILVERKEFLDNKRIRGGFGDECIDVGGTGSTDLEGAYNEICWGEKEAMDVKGGPQRVRIHHNYAHHNQFWTTLYIDGWTAPLRDIEMDHNVSCDNWGIGMAVNVEHGPLAENVKIHHNLVFNNGLSGIDSGGAGEDNPRRNIQIYNNTVVNNGHIEWNKNPCGGIMIASTNVEDVFIRDNLSVGNRDYNIAVFGPDYAQKNVVIEGNVLYPKFTIGWASDRQRAYVVHGDSPIHVRPKFVDPDAGNFRLAEPLADRKIGAFEVQAVAD